MTFMLSNDDGIHAEGINTLSSTLQRHNFPVRMIAPDRDRSGASNSLTLDRPLHPRVINQTTISINGTPTDCVHLGVHQFFRDTCERVISGINSGANLGDDVLYSGTVAAAMEGRFLDKTPVAISLLGNQHFQTAADILVRLIPFLDDMQLPKHGVININVPDLPLSEIKGMKVTRLGHRQKSDNPVVMRNPRGKECYWISTAGDVADAGEGTDFHAVEHGFVSITPIQMDMTFHDYRSKLESTVQRLENSD